MKLMLKGLLRVRNQRGLTSVVVVFILVTLLTLIGIGFTKVMNRSLQSSAASQQASAANYAAQSGVNDVLSYLKTQPATSATKCDDLIKTGAPLASAAKISSDGSTAYTCVLVDPGPTSLFYQNLAPYKSQIVKISTSAPLSSLLFSWQSPSRQHNQFVPAASNQTLYDEKTWSDKNYAPLLRLTLYPIPASGDLSNVQASSKTFFLYPQASGSNTVAYSAGGDIAQVNCSSKNLGGFSGTADYDCNLVINNLPGAAYYYARFAPYYDQAVVKIKGNDSSGQPVKFTNVQSVVDLTAKSGGATKRLQARIDTSAASGGTDLNISPGSDNAPEFALGTPNTVCKRLLVPPRGSAPVTTDAGSAANCPGFNSTNGPPTVSLTASPRTVAPRGSSTLNWTSANADSCSASGGWNGGRATSGSTSTGALSNTTSYTLTCKNAAGQGQSSAIVTVGSGGDGNCSDGIKNGDETGIDIGGRCGGGGGGGGPGGPTVSLTASPTTIKTGGSSTLNWTSANADSCTASGGWGGNRATSGSTSTGALSNTTSYTLTCKNTIGQASSSATVTVTPTGYPTISVRITSTTSWLRQSQAPAACRSLDGGTHFWLICVNWTSSMSDGTPIKPCYIYWRGDDGANSSAGPYGQNGSSSPLGFTVGAGGKGGSVYVGCTSQIYPNISGVSGSTYFPPVACQFSVDGCEQPPPPQLCQDPAANNYGGALPCTYPPPPPRCSDYGPDWSGTYPNCVYTDPGGGGGGGGGGCGLLGAPLYPNFGLMELYLGRVCL